MKGYLVLEDGVVFEGEAFGAPGHTSGEVVFNTGMTGYQEVLTDPSYAGQIVTMTYPLIGNYGINESDIESASPKVKGFIVREKSNVPSHWRAEKSLDDYLAENGIMGLEKIDTRALTRHLREHGTMKGVLTTELHSLDELVAEAQAVSMEGLVYSITTRHDYHIYGGGPRVVVVDYGVKWNILRILQAMDADIKVVPAWTAASDILEMKPDGILLSNGPGDPKDVGESIDTVRQLLGEVPMFGICLGHQIMGLAMGADTYKLKYGHRGANHPVKDLKQDRVYMTTQNHGYAVQGDSLNGLNIEVTHLNLNDNTVEGIRHKDIPAWSVQYHPEASPGPHESRYLLEDFVRSLRRQ